MEQNLKLFMFDTKHQEIHKKEYAHKLHQNLLQDVINWLDSNNFSLVRRGKETALQVTDSYSEPTATKSANLWLSITQS